MVRLGNLMTLGFLALPFLLALRCPLVGGTGAAIL